MSSVTLVAAISAATLSLAPTTVICQQSAWNHTTISNFRITIVHQILHQRIQKCSSGAIFRQSTLEIPNGSPSIPFEHNRQRGTEVIYYKTVLATTSRTAKKEVTNVWNGID